MKHYLVAASLRGLCRPSTAAPLERVLARTLQEAAIRAHLRWDLPDGEAVVYVMSASGVTKVTQVHLEQISRRDTRAGKETLHQVVSVLRTKGLGEKSETRLLRIEAASCGAST